MNIRTSFRPICQKLPIFLVVLLASLVVTLACSAQGLVAKGQADGISAELRIIGEQAIFKWRLTAPTDTANAETHAVLNGQPIKLLSSHSYPNAGETSQVLFLLDFWDRSNESALNRQKAALLYLAQRSPKHISPAFGLLGKDIRILASPELYEAMASTEAPASAIDLGGAILAGIEALASIPGDRRGLFVFTGGETSAPIDDGALVLAALQSGVAVTLVLRGGGLIENAEKFATIARKTGGQVIDDFELETFLNQPYVLLDGGGTVIFELPKGKHYYWQPHPRIDVHLSVGARQLALSLELPFHTQGVTSSIFYILYLVPPLSIVAIVIIVPLVLLAVHRYRSLGTARRHVTRPAQKNAVSAILQNPRSGSVHAIRQTPYWIGRATDCDVRLDDATVSRRHAVITVDQASQFYIANRSQSNNTAVNGRLVDQASLTHGDIITVGQTHLRFGQG